MNRRQILISGGSIVALALAPAVVMTARGAPYLAPTTNVVHLASRIGHKCLFTDDDVLRMLGLNPSKIEKTEKEPPTYCEYTNGQVRYYDYGRMEEARSLAEKGAHDIYDRAQLIIGIKRKLNLHFNFDHTAQVHWLKTPNPRLQGLAFREVMKRDIRLAFELIDKALES